MDIKKLNPWNWFKAEQDHDTKYLPAQSPTLTYGQYPTSQFHQEIDRLFEQAFRRFGNDEGLVNFLRPNVDITSNENTYAVSVEVPGIEEGDIKLELTEHALVIKGEKKQEFEKTGEHYYRSERAYGSFQRILSLPDDVQHSDIHAEFKNGVLYITMPRKQIPKSEVQHIEIKNVS